MDYVGLTTVDFNFIESASVALGIMHEGNDIE